MESGDRAVQRSGAWPGFRVTSLELFMKVLEILDVLKGIVKHMIKNLTG